MLVWRGMSKWGAGAVLREASTAALLITGRVPGRPRQLSHRLEFGGSASRPTAQPQNILLRVVGCTCTSMPITTSQGALDKWSDLRLHPARHLISAGHAQRDVLAPLRGEHLQSDGQKLFGHAAPHADPRYSPHVT